MFDGAYRRSLVIALVIAAFAAACSASLLAGCAGGYRDRYTEIINEFEERVGVDDRKSQELAEKSDLPGLIKLNGLRRSNISEVTQRIISLSPTEDLRRVHIETLYYLLALGDQLRAQDNYYEAVVSEKPSEDLKTIAENAAARAKLVGSELALDLQKGNVNVKTAPAPTSSAPPGP